MSLRASPRAPALLAVLVLPLALAAPGCGGDEGVGKTYPVRGQVTLDGQPLDSRTAVVLLKADAAKGNTTPFEPAASVDSSGSYTVYTKKQRGAPPGWYKVIVTATETESPQPTKGGLSKRPLPRSLVPGKYGQAKTTPLSIEVVESAAAGSYDLKIEK